MTMRKAKYTFTPEEMEVSPWDAAEFLDNEEMISGYLSLCLEDPDPDIFLMALGDVARARGITQLAKDTGLARESLYRTLQPGKNPRINTIRKIADALGLTVSIGANKRRSASGAGRGKRRSKAPTRRGRRRPAVATVS